MTISVFRCWKLMTGLDSLKTASKNVVHKTGEFLEYKIIADAVTKANDNEILKQKPVEEIIIPT